jgi:YD repeat-containing protein
MPQGAHEVRAKKNTYFLLGFRIRIFPQNFCLGTYDLANQLKKVTDPFGYEINYGYDKLGRLNTVTGTPFGSHNGSYIQQMSYRSWGAMKSITYGNNVTASASYNNRLQISSFELRNGNFQLAMQAEYQYYNDGKLKYAKDLLASHFDRAYQYDFVGRMTEAYTGNEARNFVNGTTGGYWDGPYRESFQQNVYGNLISETSRLWSNDPETKNYSFVNGRNTSYQYDSAGHILNDGQVQYVFDAKGLITSMTKIGTTKTHSVTYNGDGQAVKRSVPPKVGNGANVITYHLRSSVLGSVITEINSQGGRKKGFVYANGQTLAEQINIAYGGDFVKLYHFKPLVSSLAESTNSGTVIAREERDPTGMNVGLEDPIQLEIPEPIAPVRQSGGGGGLFGPSCYLDGIETDCGQVMRLAEMGALQIQVQNRQGETRYVDVELLLGFLHIPGHQEAGPSYTYQGGYRGSDPDDPNSPVIWDPNTTTEVQTILWIRDMYLPSIVQTDPLLTFNRNDLNFKLSKVKAKFDPERFKSCLDQLFGVIPNKINDVVEMEDYSTDTGLVFYQARDYGFAGNFSGKANLGIGLDNEARVKDVFVQIDGRSYSPSDLATISGADPKKVTVSGLTPGTYNGVVYVANNLNNFTKALAAAVHETGNALARETGKRPKVLSPQLLIWDDDPGNALEECVFGGKVAPNGYLYIITLKKGKY